mmetsp:Transcript_20791/g.50861  ORF Transcript_20791/g.50861 Transcript_20791/m.50861 type:complete len:225 (+) Transcript_20791:266-940(+)
MRSVVLHVAAAVAAEKRLEHGERTSVDLQQQRALENDLQLLGIWLIRTNFCLERSALRNDTIARDHGGRQYLISLINHTHALAQRGKRGLGSNDRSSHVLMDNRVFRLAIRHKRILICEGINVERPLKLGPPPPPLISIKVRLDAHNLHGRFVGVGCCSIHGLSVGQQRHLDATKAPTVLRLHALRELGYTNSGRLSIHTLLSVQMLEMTTKVRHAVMIGKNAF